MISSRVTDLACVPAALPAAERQRHFALARELLERRAMERVGLPNGYAIRFAGDAFEAVARFVANERKCCPFLTFELTLDPAAGPFWLRMTGPDGTRSVLDAELRTSPTTTANPEGRCNCTGEKEATSSLLKWAATGGVLAALGICAACCLLPFALLSVGVAGAWVSGFDALAAYKWPLIGLAVLLLGYGFYAAYIKPRRICAAGAACKVCGSSRAVRVGLWVATILTLAAIAFEHIEPMLTHLRGAASRDVTHPEVAPVSFAESSPRAA